MTVDSDLPSPNGNIVSTSSTEIIRVLHIDDEEDQQMFLKVFVEGDSNIKVTSARSAEETLELVETGAFDCLISDYDMPDMNGITLAKKIRETSNIPIIIYTGRGSEEVAESAFDAGVDDYIRKETEPAHYQIVSKRIRQVVERRRSNESYRNLFDNASDAISIVAFDGRVIDINEVGCKRLGYSKEEFLRMTINNYVASPGFDFNDYLEKIVRKGHSVFEATHITREGRLVPVEVNAKVIKYMGIDAILSFSRDISDRKRLEAQMKERLEALQSHALTLSQCENVTAVAKTTYKILHEVMGYSFFGLGLVDGDVLKFVPDLLVDGDGWSLEYPLSGPGICGRAVKTGSSIIVPDVRLDPDYIGPKSGLKYLSEVVVPVKIGGEVVAVINIEDEKRNRFTRDDVMLLEIFSEHVASSLHRIELLDKTRKSLSRIERINKHAAHLAEMNTVREVAEYSFDVIEELLGFADGCIGLVEGDVLRFKYARNLAFQIPDLPLSGRGLTAKAYRTGKSQLVQDTRLDSDFVKALDPADYLSELDVPVKVDGGVVAVINLEDRRLGFFSEEDREIVEILAEQIASAFSRIEHHETIRASEAALLKSEERFRYILDSAPEGVTVNQLGKVVYVNKHFAEMMGYSVDELLRKNVLEITKENYREMAEDRTRRRALGEDVPSRYEVELIRKDGTFLPVEYSISRIIFNGENASLTFIRDVSQRNEKRELEMKITSLHKHAHELNELQSVKDVARVTLDILHRHLNSNLLSLRSCDGENLQMLARWGAKHIRKPLPIQGKGLMARAAREKQTILVNDTHMDPDFIGGHNHALSELVVPILCKGELLGVLNAESLELNAFGENEIVLMETLADEVGSAITRIRALELEQSYNNRLEALQVNAIKLSQAGTIDEALDTTCEILEKIFDYNWVGIGRVGEESIHYVRVLGSGLVGNDKISLDRRSITVRAIKSGATQLVPDTSKDEDYIVMNPGDVTASSELVVPIRVNGRVEFVMNLESMKLDAFSEQEKHLIELLALHFGSAIELIRKRKKLNSIHLHASRLGSVDDIGRIAKLTLDTLKEVLDFKISSFHVVKNEVIEMIETIGFNMESQFIQPLSGPGLIPYAMRECRPIYAPDVTCDEHYVRGPLNLEDEQSSEFVVPIIIAGVSVAAINLEDKRTNGFTDEDQELVEFLSEHVASAIQRINHYEIIKASEEKYRNLLDASFDGMIMASETKITYANQSIVKLLGYNDQSELIGLDASAILLKNDYESMRRGIFRIQSSVRSLNKYELRLLKKDGKTIEVEASFTLTEFEGKPVALAVIKDISESKRFERQMVALRDHAYNLPETTNIEEVCQVTLDAVESVIGFNLGSFLIVNGSDLESIGNRGSPNLGRPIPIDGVGITAKAARRRTPILVNDVREDSDFLKGTSNSLSELAVPVILEGETVAVLNFESPELSAFNEVDQRLLETFAVNISSAIYRIRELDKLRKQDEEKARELMGGAEKIVSMVRNDLRTPLQMIQNASYLLRRRFIGAEDYTSKIDAGVEYAAKILDDLKMMMSLPQLKVEKLEYNDLVKNCLEDANIPTSLNVDARYGAPVFGEADSYKIKRVVDNLVKNAVEAMPNGGTLSVRVEAAEEMAVLTIGDTGQGIPDEVARNLFTPFYTTKSEGTGLGLAICKQIVEAHRGKITFESRVKEGTSFTVALPLSPRALPNDEERVKSYIKNSASLVRPKKRNIGSHR